MCTVTIIKLKNNNSKTGRWLITMNRDEALNRREGQPVAVHKNNEPQSWRPVDAQAGGSWFGVSKGCAMALLNRYQDADAFNAKLQSAPLNSQFALESRGRLIEELLTCKNTKAIDCTLKAFRLRNFAPFDLLIMHINILKPTLRKLSWTGTQWLSDQNELPEIFFHTSSSVDYEDARTHRLQAFNALLLPEQRDKSSAFSGVDVSAKAMLNLHQARCDTNPSLGFNMQRPGRHTKSICQAIITPEDFDVNYYQAPF